MLQKLGDHIRACYERAAQCAEQAKTKTNEKIRDDLLKMKKSCSCWTLTDAGR